jgi:serine/threonine protein kinase
MTEPNTKDLSEKYNLMEITKDKLDQIDENKVGPGVHIGLLYGMPVILYNIGKNTTFIQNTVSELSKYNHPSLALNYGYLIEKEKTSEYKDTNKVYIVRELVIGKNLHNIRLYHVHDRLVILYKLICLLEYLHSFDIFYLFLHPAKAIITQDLEI